MIPSLRSLARVAVALALLGCGDAPRGERVEAGPPTSRPAVYERDGVPGPWWREGATEEMFDAEHRLCLARSREARGEAGADRAADAAYRAFLECMQQQSWQRGLPPLPPTS